jgi:hypothetical protein
MVTPENSGFTAAQIAEAQALTAALPIDQQINLGMIAGVFSALTNTKSKATSADYIAALDIALRRLMRLWRMAAQGRSIDAAVDRCLADVRNELRTAESAMKP